MTISFAVIAYQALIVWTIVSAGKAGMANLVAALWGIWTLVQVTFMSPLFFLQLLVIIITWLFATAQERDANSQRESNYDAVDPKRFFQEARPEQKERKLSPRQKPVGLQIRRESGPSTEPGLLHVYKIVGKQWIKVGYSLRSNRRQVIEDYKTPDFTADLLTLHQAILPYWADPEEVELEIHAAMLEKGLDRVPLASSREIFLTRNETYEKTVSFLSSVVNKLFPGEKVTLDPVGKDEYWLLHRQTEDDQPSWVDFGAIGNDKK